MTDRKRTGAEIPKGIRLDPVTDRKRTGAEIPNGIRLDAADLTAPQQPDSSREFGSIP